MKILKSRKTQKKLKLVERCNSNFMDFFQRQGTIFIKINPQMTYLLTEK